MGRQTKAGDVFATLASLYLLAATLMTLIFGLFMQWIPVIGAIVVSGWVTQAATSRSRKGKR
jgi:hypothetical protein